MSQVRFDWEKKEIEKLLSRDLLDLVFEAAQIHRENFQPGVQLSSLLSIKTGSCPENCSYCPQSAHYKTDVEKHSLLAKEDVLQFADSAKKSGASRVCLGAAWREVKDNKDFDQVLEMVKSISSMDLQVCCTLGMLTESQAIRLKDAGLYAYNHNIDTSREHYKNIITTRTFDDRLETISNVRKAGITVCCGGILGLGESFEDKVSFLQTLSNLNPHPESVPINVLVPMKGTPLEGNLEVKFFDLLRVIAAARILMPKSFVRLSAGRKNLSQSEHALCFLAGANSIFAGEKLLTTGNPEYDEDLSMLKNLGLKTLYQNEQAYQ